MYLHTCMHIMAFYGVPLTKHTSWSILYRPRASRVETIVLFWKKPNVSPSSRMSSVSVMLDKQTNISLIYIYIYIYTYMSMIRKERTRNQ